MLAYSQRKFYQPYEVRPGFSFDNSLTLTAFLGHSNRTAHPHLKFSPALKTGKLSGAIDRDRSAPRQSQNRERVAHYSEQEYADYLAQQLRRAIRPRDNRHCAVQVYANQGL